jgi:hypothetical protein
LNASLLLGNTMGFPHGIKIRHNSGVGNRVLVIGPYFRGVRTQFGGNTVLGHATILYFRAGSGLAIIKLSQINQGRFSFMDPLSAIAGISTVLYCTVHTTVIALLNSPFPSLPISSMIILQADLISPMPSIPSWTVP